MTTITETLPDLIGYYIESFVPAKVGHDPSYQDAHNQRLTDLMRMQGFTVVEPAHARVLQDDEIGDCRLPLGYVMLHSTVLVREFDVPVDPDEREPGAQDVRIEAPVITPYSQGATFETSFDQG